jgi:predicted dinucleotide-binding enzyme
MNLGILGSGQVGGTLGVAWGSRGHFVCFGARDPQAEKVQRLVGAAGFGARAGTIRAAAEFGDVLVLAPPWPAVPEVLQAAGDLAGKVLIDCTNPVTPDLKALAIGHTTSAGEEVAKLAPGAKVVKAFNTIGADHLAEPHFQAMPATMPVCGDDLEAKRAVARLAVELGWEVVDVGPLANARLLEPLAMYWIWLAVHGSMGRDFALKLLRK